MAKQEAKQPQKAKPMAAKTNVVEVSLKDMPEVLADMRRQLAQSLRTEASRRWASSEQTVVDMAVKESLERVACCIEAAITSEESLKVNG